MLRENRQPDGGSQTRRLGKARVRVAARAGTGAPLGLDMKNDRGGAVIAAPR
jgi:hypothetical protein